METHRGATAPVFHRLSHHTPLYLPWMHLVDHKRSSERAWIDVWRNPLPHHTVYGERESRRSMFCLVLLTKKNKKLVRPLRYLFIHVFRLLYIYRAFYVVVLAAQRAESRVENCCPDAIMLCLTPGTPYVRTRRSFMPCTTAVYSLKYSFQ